MALHRLYNYHNNAYFMLSVRLAHCLFITLHFHTSLHIISLNTWGIRKQKHHLLDFYKYRSFGRHVESDISILAPFLKPLSLLGMSLQDFGKPLLQRPSILPLQIQ